MLGVETKGDTGAGLGDLLSVSAPALRDAWIKTSRSLWLMSGDISMALTVAWSWDTSWLWARDSLDRWERPPPLPVTGLTQSCAAARLKAAWYGLRLGPLEMLLIGSGVTSVSLASLPVTAAACSCLICLCRSSSILLMPWSLIISLRGRGREEPETGARQILSMWSM